VLTAWIRRLHQFSVEETHDTNDADEEADEEKRASGPFRAAVELQTENDRYDIDDAERDNSYTLSVYVMSASHPVPTS
jgi:CBS domain containing-hemolysin-like protein